MHSFIHAFRARMCHTRSTCTSTVPAQTVVLWPRLKRSGPAPGQVGLCPSGSLRPLLSFLLGACGLRRPFVDGGGRPVLAAVFHSSGPATFLEFTVMDFVAYVYVSELEGHVSAEIILALASPEATGLSLLLFYLSHFSVLLSPSAVASLFHIIPMVSHAFRMSTSLFARA